MGQSAGRLQSLPHTVYFQNDHHALWNTMRHESFVARAYTYPAGRHGQAG
jgi:hypothetical protein